MTAMSCLAGVGLILSRSRDAWVAAIWGQEATQASQLQMNFRRNILIFHLGALGDFVVTWPLALALGRIFAQSRIIYVTHASKGKLAEKVLRVESADAENGWHALFAESPKLPEYCEKLLNGAQAIFNFVSRPEDQWSRNILGRQPSLPMACIETRSADAPNIHVTTLIAGQLAASPQIATGVAQMVRSIESRGVGLNRAGGTDVVIHPGGGSPAKCWPVDRYVQLIGRLIEAGKQVRVLVGEVERERWGAAKIDQLASLAQVRQPATYLDLLQELSTAGAFIGNDSGPGHLAAMIGVPTVSIFGADPARWRPIGPRVRVVHADSLDAISVERIVEAIKTL